VGGRVRPRLVHRCLDVRHPHILGLDTVDQVAEHPTSPRRSLITQTMGAVALMARAAATTRSDARDDHVVPDREPGNRAARLSGHAAPVVTEDGAWCDSRHVACTLRRSVPQVVVSPGP
jgi:hypothetical protein